MKKPLVKQFDKITHSKYGEGMVIYVNQRYKSNLYMVRFGKVCEFFVDDEIKNLLETGKRKDKDSNEQ